MNKGVVAFFLVVLTAALLHEAVAVECNPKVLSPCQGAISSGTDPSAECCSKLKEQQPCFCQYIKNPQFKTYIDSPNARNVAAVCGITIPTC